VIDVLAILPEDKVEYYQAELGQANVLKLDFATNHESAVGMITGHPVDVVLVDAELDGEDVFVAMLRQRYPRLLVIVVDEGADFGFPGHADAISTDPFQDDELIAQIQQLVHNRHDEAMSGDNLPVIRDVSNRLRSATDLAGKAQAAVEAVRSLGYDYVAYYHAGNGLRLKAQVGPSAVNAIAPESAEPDDLMTWVAQNQRSHIAGPDDRPTHPLVARGRLGAVVCVPVSAGGQRRGVIAVCNDRPGSINQESVMLLELIAAQLASALDAL
jgi:hypothetical protein